METIELSGDVTLHAGDCLDVLRTLDDESVDAVVTDPPYGIAFMGKRWDYQIPPIAVWQESLRVLKDGGRLMSFASPRTMHRMWCTIEDAGFVIEDSVMWLFGTGFPKHASKLKPAFEPICVARKGSVSDLNIDACRIPSSEEDREAWKRRMGTCGESFKNRTFGNIAGSSSPTHEDGRYPTNVVHDGSGEVESLFDEQTPGRSRRPSSGGLSTNSRRVYGGFPGDDYRAEAGFRDDEGGSISRFFYCAKASSRERDQGLEAVPEGIADPYAGHRGRRMAGGSDRIDGRPARTGRNTHPTVKPVALMRWLVRMVAKPGDAVLDPFMGSGTTGMACITEGVRFIGVDLNPEYVDIAARRISSVQPSIFS